MTAHLEDLIRAAQQARAEAAPDPGRVRAGLPARAARRRRTRRLTVAASVAAAVALLAGVLTVDRGGSATPPRPEYPAPTASPTAAERDPAPVEYRVPLRLRPTWMPAGYGERFRHAELRDGGPVVTRIWTRGPVGTVARDTGEGLVLKIGEPPRAGGTPVDVNGVTGHVLDRTVSWRRDGVDVELTGRDAAVPAADLLRAARSVRPDDEMLTTGLLIAPLRDGATATATAVSVGGDDLMSSYSSQTLVVPGAGITITVDLGSETSAPPGGEGISIGGQPARLLHQAGTTYLIFDIYQPSWTLTVTVTGPMTDAEIQAIVPRIAGAPIDRGEWFGRP